MKKSNQYRNIVILTVFFLILTIGYSVIQSFTDKPLVVTHEMRGTGIYPTSTSNVGLFGEKELPISFQVGRVNELTLHSHRFYFKLKLGDTIRFRFNSSEPIDFKALFSDEPVWDSYASRDDHMELVDEVSITSYSGWFRAKREGYVTFYFETDCETLADVTLDGHYISALNFLQR